MTPLTPSQQRAAAFGHAQAAHARSIGISELEQLVDELETRPDRAGRGDLERARWQLARLRAAEAADQAARREAA